MNEGHPIADRTTGSRFLRELRLRAALTQEALAEASGVSVRTIREVEAGRARPTPTTARLLAAAMRLTPAEVSGDASATPVELPMATPGFTGRAEALAAIDAAVRAGATGVGVHGMLGVGKTAVAVHAAHALAPAFPDGQVYVDLGDARDTGTVLRRVLRGLGATEPAPDADLGEIAARYRSVLAHRRVLVVYDNAAGPDQVAALLPGRTGSSVLVTSRRSLSDVDGLFPVALTVPPAFEAATMLRSGAPGRVGPRDALAIADLCGRLPLAMRLAAARLRNRPFWTGRDLLARLRDGGRLLDELDLGSRRLSGPLGLAVDALDPVRCRVLRLLSLLPAGEVGEYDVSVLSRLPRRTAAGALESLVDMSLLESRTPGRYRLHVLVRHLARRLAEAEAEPLPSPSRGAGAAPLEGIQLTVPG